MRRDEIAKEVVHALSNRGGNRAPPQQSGRDVGDLALVLPDDDLFGIGIGDAAHQLSRKHQVDKLSAGDRLQVEAQHGRVFGIGRRRSNPFDGHLRPSREHHIDLAVGVPVAGRKVQRNPLDAGKECSQLSGCRLVGRQLLPGERLLRQVGVLLGRLRFGDISAGLLVRLAGWLGFRRLRRSGQTKKFLALVFVPLGLLTPPLARLLRLRQIGGRLQRIGGRLRQIGGRLQRIGLGGQLCRFGRLDGRLFGLLRRRFRCCRGRF